MKAHFRTSAGFLAACVVSLLLQSAPAANVTSSAPSARPAPDWLRRSVVYEIFPRNFSQEGTFNAITARLDELKDLGVDVLWLMPIQPIGEMNRKGTLGSPYAVRDFRAINPNLGTTNDFQRLINEAHQRDMKVILDIIEGHTAWDSVLMEQPEFYVKDDAGEIVSPNPGWTDVAALDYTNPELRRYMIDMLLYWVTEFNVDGFRCDVSFSVPLEFWEAARAELETANPDVMLFADANATPALLQKAFDMDNSWPLLSALNRVMSGLWPATLVEHSWRQTREQFPEGALHLRFSDNHEEVRAVARYGVQGALAAQVLMLTLDGVPLFYNGMEVGDASESADPALFEKVPIFWDPPGRPPFRQIYRNLIRIRKEYPAFLNNKVSWLQTTTPAEVVSFMRQDDKDQFVVLINLSSRMVAGSLEVMESAGFKPVSIEGVTPTTSDALPGFRLAGYEWRIYHRAAPE